MKPDRSRGRLFFRGIVVVLLGGLAVWVNHLANRDPGRLVTPFGKRDSALYVRMKDGTRIAIDVWLPPGIARNDRIPALLHMTRYVRAFERTWLGRVLAGMHLAEWVPPEVAPFNQRGYAVVLVDARGSGASSGYRPTEMPPAEVDDYGQVVDWIVNQGWSNGKVGAFGASYVGNTSEALAGAGRAAVRAVAPEVSDYDPFLGLVWPGGAVNRVFSSAWSDFVANLDRNEVVRAYHSINGRSLFDWTTRGIKPVDGDERHELLNRSLREREGRNLDVMAGIKRMIDLDDSASFGGITPRAMSLYRYSKQLEAGGAAIFAEVGWIEAGTANGALARFKTANSPQQVWLTPRRHRMSGLNDPFRPGVEQPDGVLRSGFERTVAFFDRYLKTDATPAGREIFYYTFNHGGRLPAYRRTEVWPPAGIATERWYLVADRQLSPVPSGGSDTTDSYTVDFAHASSNDPRWDQFGRQAIGDRADADRRALVYTSAPVLQDMEITGSPVLSLEVASSATDGLFIGYLELVAPDGRVFYVTEGVLRAQHRAVAKEPPPYFQFGPYHSMSRADAAPLIPGQVTTIAFDLLATSVLVPKGWRIRLALAGHDESSFLRVPADGTPVWSVHRGGTRPSFVDLPIRRLPTQ